jgi:hypothetical protein
MAANSTRDDLMDRLALPCSDWSRLGVELAHHQNPASRRPPFFSHRIAGEAAGLILASIAL